MNPHDAVGRMLSERDVEAFDAWLAEGNDPVERDEFGETLLHRATSSYSIPIMKRLLELGIDPNIPDKEGNPPLSNAFHGEPAVLLLRHGASLTVENAEGLSPLHYAARMGRAEVVSALIAMGADMNAPCFGSEYSAPFEAFVLGEFTISVLAAFAAAGFDMKGKDGQWTLLHRAVLDRHYDARDFLLHLGCDPLFKDDEGQDVAAIEERNRRIDALRNRP